MSNKLCEVYDFKVLEGTAVRARVANSLNYHWKEFRKGLDAFEKSNGEWDLMSEALFDLLNLMRIYVGFLEEIGLIRTTRSCEIYGVLDDAQKKVIAVQIEKCVENRLVEE